MKLTPSPFAPAAFPNLPEIAGVQAATACKGFYGSARDDVFLCTFQPGTVAGGVFTQSTTASDDVERCRAALLAGNGAARALVVNAGNSNAFTGTAGIAKNDATMAALETSLGVDAATCFLAATGVIGEPLDRVDAIATLVPVMVETLGPTPWEAVASAFMTTDTYPKGAGRQVDLDGTTISLSGIAKGSGMIAPNMATMLAYIFSDVAIDARLLQDLTAEIADATFNTITVDSDTSTSDTFMVFATGAAEMVPIVDRADPRCDGFVEALTRVALNLAHQVVKDGEGAQKFISVRVSGAGSDMDARRVAVAVANSPLVKTALAAGDANWGRIIMAVGKSGVALDQAGLGIWIGDHMIAEKGARAPDYDEATANGLCAKPEIDIHVDLGGEAGDCVVYTCDLTHAYIDINGAYRT